MFGTLVMFALSALVYRCAAITQRRRWLWVLLLWCFVFGGGMVAAAIAVVVYESRGVIFPTEKEAAEALVPATGLGMLAGAIGCVWFVCRTEAPRFSLRGMLLVMTLLALLLGLIVWDG